MYIDFEAIILLPVFITGSIKESFGWLIIRLIVLVVLCHCIISVRKFYSTNVKSIPLMSVRPNWGGVAAGRETKTTTKKKIKKNIKQQLKFHFGRAGKKKRTNTEKKGLERSRSLAMNIIVLFVVNTVLEGVRRIADKLQQHHHHHHHQYQRIIRTATRRIRFNLSPLGKSKKRRKVLLLHFPLDVRYKPHKFFLFILSMLR